MPRLGIAIAICGLLGASCAGMFAAQAGEGAVQGALTSMEDPQTRRDLARLLESPEMRGATRALAAEAAAGFVDGLATRLDPEARRELAKAIGETLDRSVTPRIGAWSGAGARSLMQEFSRPETQEELGALAANLSRAAGKSAAGGVTEQLEGGPEKDPFASIRSVLTQTNVLLLFLTAVAAVLLVGMIFWAIRRYRRMHPRHIAEPTFGVRAPVAATSRESLRAELLSLLREPEMRRIVSEAMRREPPEAHH